MNARGAVTFSVLMPLYNHERYVCEAIDSVLAQSHDNFELIVCDDGSTDRSAAVVEKYTDPRVKLFRKANGGVASALNYALAHSTGDVLTWLSSDDLYARTNLETHSKALTDGHDVSVTKAATFDEHLNILPYEWSLQPPQRDRLATFFLKYNYINGLSIAFTRRAFATTGMFNPRYRYAQDEDYWIRLLRQYRPEFIESAEFQVLSRVGSSTFQVASPAVHLDTYLVAYETVLRDGLFAFVPTEWLDSEDVPSALGYALNVLRDPAFRLRRLGLTDQVAIAAYGHLQRANLLSDSARECLLQIVQCICAQQLTPSLRERSQEALAHISRNGDDYLPPSSFHSHLKLLMQDGWLPERRKEINEYVSRL